jgi:aquaporin NIP
MAGAELANGLHESTVNMEEGRGGGGEAYSESSEQDGAVSRPMFSVPFVQKVCSLLP